MADVETLPAFERTTRLNVADRLTRVATAMSDSIAVSCPWRRASGKQAAHRCQSGTTYATTTFAELDADATRIARGLLAWGVPPGTRLALLVRPGIEFVTLVFALLRAGMVIVLVDPGMGRRNLIRCLADAEPEGFVGIAAAQAARLLFRRRFPRARWNVTVGRRRFWGGQTLDQLRTHAAAGNPKLPDTRPDSPAAIIFTSGSTGPPKGVLYTHRMFEKQVAEIQSAYNIEPGGVDLACFPLFALFNAAMGVNTVLPEMDFSRPAAADPKKLLRAANDWQVTQAFASPAVWRLLGDHCAKTGERIESLRQVFSCGAPVPASVIRQTLACVGAGAKMHTPYGATECLPVSTIKAAEILDETAAATDRGAGVCVGRKFDSIDWRVIKISDEPITSIDEAEELPPGEIGELIVRGPQVSPEYVTRRDANTIAKIGDVRPVEHTSSVSNWHRAGDVGYFDAHGRFWYCGRKSQRVETASGPMFTECVEAIFNRHPDVTRAALVGIGLPNDQLPVVAIQFNDRIRITRYSGRDAFADFQSLAEKIASPSIPLDWLDFDDMPVDIRHNAKINREWLRGSTAFGILAKATVFDPELVRRAQLSRNH
jgi:olefin beta-lactone synthetase